MRKFASLPHVVASSRPSQAGGMHQHQPWGSLRRFEIRIILGVHWSENQL